MLLLKIFVLFCALLIADLLVIAAVLTSEDRAQLNRALNINSRVLTGLGGRIYRVSTVTNYLVALLRAFVFVGRYFPTERVVALANQMTRVIDLLVWLDHAESALTSFGPKLADPAVAAYLMLTLFFVAMTWVHLKAAN
jgi:hypothetical protein